MGNVETATYKIQVDQDLRGATFLKIRDVIIYVMFMAMILTMTYGAYTWNAYHLTQAVESSFIKRTYYCEEERTLIYNVSENREVWCYLNNSFILVLELEPFWGEKTTKNETILLTKPRFRQVRAVKRDCILPLTTDECASFFSTENEDKSSYNLKEGTAWNYTPPEIMGHNWFTGRASYYNSAGYYFIYENRSQLEFYRQNDWIDSQTRALFIEFTFYNFNINMFCVCQIFFEYLPTGGVIPSYYISTVKLMNYLDKFDYIVLACQIVFAIMTLYYTAELIIEVVYYKIRFATVWHNWVDFIIVGMCWSSVGVLVSTEIHTQHFFDSVDWTADFVNYQILNQVKLLSERITAVTLFCSFIKMYRYLHFDTMDRLYTTIKFCARDMLSFTVLFLVIVFAFAVQTTLLFGNSVESYKTIFFSYFTLLRILLGEFEYQNVSKIYRYVGPVIIVLYVLFVVFLLLNMFLAIINATYSVVTSSVKITRKVQYKPFVRHCFYTIFKVSPKKRDDKKRKLTNTEKVKDMLLNSGFTDFEVQMFFSRFSVDDDREIPIQVFRKIVKKTVPPQYLADVTERTQILQANFIEVMKKADNFFNRVNKLRAYANAPTENTAV